MTPFILISVLLAAGVAGWFAAGWLERHGTSKGWRDDHPTLDPKDWH